MERAFFVPCMRSPSVPSFGDSPSPSLPHCRLLVRTFVSWQRLQGERGLGQIAKRELRNALGQMITPPPRQTTLILISPSPIPKMLHSFAVFCAEVFF